MVKLKTKTFRLSAFMLLVGSAFMFFNGCSGVGLENQDPAVSRELDGGNEILQEFAKESKASSKIRTDFLLIFYMDGDNNLNDPIYFDLNEIEHGISFIRNDNGTPKNGYASVSVLALWDGWKDRSKVLGDGKTHLYELGADSQSIYNFSGSSIDPSSPAFKLSSKTKDLTSSASFIRNREVNMGSVSTLTSYLNWVLERYEADNIILQFSNHGGGPRSAVKETVVLDSGLEVVSDLNKLRRSMCWDDGSGTSFLKTKDVPVALRNAKFGSSNKLSLIIEDVCLGSSVEEAYELRNYSDYFLASPNNVPGMGMNYVDFMKSFTKNATITDIGKGMVEAYKADYTTEVPDWEAQIAKFYGRSSYNNFKRDINSYSREEKARLYDYYLLANHDASTISFIDLSKLDAVKNGVKEFSAEFLSLKNKSVTENGKSVKFTDMILDKLLQGFGSLSYEGSFTHLFDAGYLSYASGYYAKEFGFTSLNAAAEKLNRALGDAVVYSWKDGFSYDSSFILSEGELYYKNGYGVHSSYFDAASGSLISSFGLTISGGTSGSRNQKLVQLYPSFYKTDLAFGKDSGWDAVLEYLFPKN